MTRAPAQPPKFAVGDRVRSLARYHASAPVGSVLEVEADGRGLGFHWYLVTFEFQGERRGTVLDRVGESEIVREDAAPAAEAP